MQQCGAQPAHSAHSLHAFSLFMLLLRAWESGEVPPELGTGAELLMLNDARAKAQGQVQPLPFPHPLEAAALCAAVRLRSGNSATASSAAKWCLEHLPGVCDGQPELKAVLGSIIQQPESSSKPELGVQLLRVVLGRRPARQHADVLMCLSGMIAPLV